MAGRAATAGEDPPGVGGCWSGAVSASPRRCQPLWSVPHQTRPGPKRCRSPGHGGPSKVVWKRPRGRWALTTTRGGVGPAGLGISRARCGPTPARSSTGGPPSCRGVTKPSAPRPNAEWPGALHGAAGPDVPLGLPEIGRRFWRIVLVVPQTVIQILAWARWRRGPHRLANYAHDTQRGAWPLLVAASACTYHCSTNHCSTKWPKSSRVPSPEWPPLLRGPDDCLPWHWRTIVSLPPAPPILARAASGSPPGAFPTIERDCGAAC